jgi:propanol-preferring alcohol dehydrogenase
MVDLPSRYLAMALLQRGARRLQPLERAHAPLGPRQLRLRVHCCGVCRTDLHLVADELPECTLPRVPGHEIVGTLVESGPDCSRFTIGQRIGVPWLHQSCGHCRWCCTQRENLCDSPLFTGWTADGGYAEYAIAHEDFALALPPNYGDEQAAPLLCAGLIGYRALSMAPDARTLGLYGFGAAAHLIAQVALQQGRTVFAFTRPGDHAAQQLAHSLGVHWAGESTATPPERIDGALIFAAAGELVPQALTHSQPGSTIVCAGIHMSDIPSFPYRLLWMERSVRSVANLTRRDGEDFFAWAASHTLHVHTTGYPLADANRALDDLRSGRLSGAAVLHCL